MELQRELETATGLAHEAGELLLEYFGTTGSQGRPKGPRDIVTAADVDSERLIVGGLKDRFPEDGIVAEEGSQESARAGRRWFVDPLDGTVNYSRGVPFWCVSLALFEGREPLVGVIHDPIRRETFHAAKGQGSWCDGAGMRCTSVQDPSESLVHLTVDFNDDSMLAGLEDLLVLAPAVFRTRNTGSVSLALAYLAAGRFDAVAHRFATTWDYGAGIVLVREAGGVASDMQGAVYTDRTVAVLAAANQTLHDRLLSLLTTRPAPE